MSQLSLYIDEETLHKIEVAASIEHVSVSKWVRERLKLSLAKTWPKGYFDLYGSIKDKSFKKHRDLKMVDDLKREKL